ncbi:MAG: hypothetical protein WD845_17075 [Pirellulales bacterium]
MLGLRSTTDRPSKLRATGAATLAMALLLVTGCGHLPLARRTVQQAATLTDMQYQQVLNNLAMFSCNPHALAWHVKITGGVVQLADQGGGYIAGNLGGPGSVAPNVTLQRNVLGQWNVEPVIESGDLELLQIAYAKALDPLDIEGSIKRQAYEQICEMADAYHIAVSRDVAFDLIAMMIEHAQPQQLERIERIRSQLVRLYDEIDQLAITAQPYEPETFRRSGPEAPDKVEFLREQVVRLLFEACQHPVGQVRAYHRPGRNVGLVEQAEAKIEALLQLFDEHEGGPPNPFGGPWVCHGCKADVPPCACLVGKYKGCEGECYAWILPENTERFRDFVLIVLALAPPTAQDTAAPQAGLGAANNPNF